MIAQVVFCHVILLFFPHVDLKITHKPYTYLNSLLYWFHGHVLFYTKLSLELNHCPIHR